MEPDGTVTTSDNPGVAILPPVLYGGAFVLVLLLQWIWPLKIVCQPIAFWLGLALSVPALVIGAWGRRTMHGARTNISPLKPAVSLFTTCPYRFSRNPLYVSIKL